GEPGIAGATGPQGIQGEIGATGTGIVNITGLAGGLMIIETSDGNFYTVQVQAPAGADGTNGLDGQDGISVTNTYINTSGHLIVTLSNGDIIDAGLAKGPQGEPGDPASDNQTLTL